MGTILSTKDGKNHTIFSTKDIFDVITEYCGEETVELLKDCMDLKSHAEILEACIEELKQNKKDCGGYCLMNDIIEDIQTVIDNEKGQ